MLDDKSDNEDAFKLSEPADDDSDFGPMKKAPAKPK